MMQRLRRLSPALATLCECNVNGAMAASTSAMTVGNRATHVDQVDWAQGVPTTIPHSRATLSCLSCLKTQTSYALDSPSLPSGGPYARTFQSSAHSQRGPVRGDDGDDIYGSDKEDDEEEEEDSIWEQYREVDEDDDDDHDELEPNLNPRRRLIRLSDDGEGNALEAPDNAELDDAAAAESDPDQGMDGHLVGGRAQYEQQLDMHVKRILDIAQKTKSKDFKKMTKKQKEDFIREAAMNNPPPGIDPPTIVKPGLEQLGKLLENGRWCTTFVDVKLTTKQTPQGKKQRYSVMVMVGDLNGTGGYGVGVAKEPNEATLKALRIALLNAVVIPRYRQRTVYFPHHTKFIKTEMSIFPRPLEFGLMAPPVLVEACELLGLHDLTVKTHKSRNTRNVVKCFFQALCAIPTPQEISEAKGCYMREKLGSKIRAPKLMESR